MASIVNFSGGPHNSYRLGLPHPGRWNEILNTDAEQYGGSGVGNLGSVVAEEIPWHGQPYSALVTLPPLGAVWLEPARPAGPPALTDAETAHQTEPTRAGPAAGPVVTPDGTEPTGAGPAAGPVVTAAPTRPSEGTR